MRNRLLIGTLSALGVAFLALLYLRAPRMNVVDAQSGPSILIDMSPDSAPRGSDIVAIIELHNLTASSNANLTYRMDVTQRASGNDADICEGSFMGSDQSLNIVDDNPEYVAGFTSTACPAGAYRLHVRLLDSANVELASGTADFDILPATDTPTPTPTSIFEGYSGWRAEYFDNDSLSGRPVLVRDDANINFNWGSGSPATRRADRQLLRALAAFRHLRRRPHLPLQPQEERRRPRLV